MYEHDTIAAIATPAGSGGVAIVRISGERAEPVVRAVFQPDQPWAHLHSHHLYLGRVTDPLTGQTLDQALLALMRAPHSYTGEDVAEVQCHGGSFLAGEFWKPCSSTGRGWPCRASSPGAPF